MTSPEGHLPPNHVLITASFGRILRKSLLNTFHPHRRLNVHPSLLPAYRGAAPIQHALLNGEEETGVCVLSMLEMKEGIDTGDIWGSKKLVSTGCEGAVSFGISLMTLFIYSADTKRCDVSFSSRLSGRRRRKPLSFCASRHALWKGTRPYSLFVSPRSHLLIFTEFFRHHRQHSHHCSLPIRNLQIPHLLHLPGPSSLSPLNRLNRSSATTVPFLIISHSRSAPKRDALFNYTTFQKSPPPHPPPQTEEAKNSAGNYRKFLEQRNTFPLKMQC